MKNVNARSSFTLSSNNVSRRSRSERTKKLNSYSMNATLKPKPMLRLTSSSNAGAPSG